MVLTQAGLYKMDMKNEKFYPFTDDEKVADLLDERLAYETFHIDRADRLWLGNTEGGVVCILLNNNKIIRYAYQPEDSTSIGKFKVVDIFEDRRGNIFFWYFRIGSVQIQFPERFFYQLYPSEPSYPQ